MKFLGREHSSIEAISTITKAAEIFDNYSFDLIYTRPGQTNQSWAKELEEAIKLANNHISIYQLTIEKGTKFYSMYKNGDFIRVLSSTQMVVEERDNYEEDFF